mmetsp:Transcript_7175/g.15584  ORF Transcript_7175/g.15584 Transcript_7175/m.15584 type:complete len:81 (-) Transcript_7175:1722-1964(-)
MGMLEAIDDIGATPGELTGPPIALVWVAVAFVVPMAKAAAVAIGDTVVRYGRWTGGGIADFVEGRWTGGGIMEGWAIRGR